MKIVIIGTGNTATVLGRKLKNSAHQIIQVCGRNAKAAKVLADELKTEPTVNWYAINPSADIYILAVSDIAIEEVIKKIKVKDKIIVHTAGAVSKNILRNATSRYGVFYPLQSLKKDTGYIPDIPIIIDAGDQTTMELLAVLAHSISENVIEADDEKRLKMHLAAVFVNNFVNHLFVLAEQYCKKENIDFSILIPLVKETAARLENIPPHQSQTGPAIRNDINTIEKHLEMLEKYPQLKNIYEIFTESIYDNRKS